MPHRETPQQLLERLELELEELRASRERLVLAANADRRGIERGLHDGPQQHLVALAVKVQLVRLLVDSDPAAAKGLLDEMGRDVRQALDEAGRLASRIYPPLLDAGGIAHALRATASELGIQARIDVTPGIGYTPEVAAAVYFCCADVLECVGDASTVTITVHEEGAAVVFGVAARGFASGTTSDAVDLSRVCDRVEALRGTLTLEPEPGSICVVGSLPLSP